MWDSPQISREFEAQRRVGWGLTATVGKRGSTTATEQQGVTQQQQQLLPWVTGQKSSLRFLTWLYADTSLNPVDADSALSPHPILTPSHPPISCSTLYPPSLSHREGEGPTRAPTEKIHHAGRRSERGVNPSQSQGRTFLH